MNILGLDTCTETIDTALVFDGVLKAERRGTSPRQQLTKLMPFIAELFESTNTKLKDLDLIAVTTGPGSFTGIRLGLATAQTLAQVLDLSLTPVNTLDALALNCSEDGIVIPSMDARKNEVFFGVYRKEGTALERLQHCERVHIDEYLGFLASKKYEKFQILGSVLKGYGDRVAGIVPPEYRNTPEELWTPRGERIARLGESMAKKGTSFDYMHLQAYYGRAFETVRPGPLV